MSILINKKSPFIITPGLYGFVWTGESSLNLYLSKIVVDICDQHTN